MRLREALTTGAWCCGPRDMCRRVLQVDVNGNNAEPVFNFLKASKGELFGASATT